MSLPLNFVKLTAFCLLLSPGLAVALDCSVAGLVVTTGHLIDNQKGIISDPNIRLEWKKCSEGQLFDAVGNGCTGTISEFTWEEALVRAQVVNAGTGGENIEGLQHTDWRVPTIKELGSIVELSCFRPAVNVTLFPAMDGDVHWSSSPHANGSSAWTIDFDSGLSARTTKSFNNPLQLVRSVQ